MPTFDISIRDGSGIGSVPVTTLAFADIVPTVPTAEATVFLWNGFSPTGIPPVIDDFTEGRFSVSGHVDPAPAGTQFTGSGLVALDGMATKMRIISSNRPTQGPTAEIGVGAGATFPLPVLESGEWVELGIKLDLPSTPSGNVILSMEMAQRTASPVPVGIPNGIINGLGDEGVTYVAERGATLESAVPDDTINLAAVQVMKKGVQWTEAAHTETFDDLDGSAVTLAAGESYAVAITLGQAGLTLTEADKTTQPVTAADLPTLPDGEELFAWVEVPFGLVIEQIHIHDILPAALFTPTAIGTDLQVGPGRGISNSHDVIWQTVRLHPFGAFGTTVEGDVHIITIDSSGEGLTSTRVWDETLGAATGNVPPGNALQIAQVTIPGFPPGTPLTVERLAETGL